MPWGIRQWDPNTGVQYLDTYTDTVNRLFGRLTLDDNAGSYSDDRFLAGQPYVMLNYVAAVNQATPKQFSFSGRTLSWTAGPATSLILGVGPGVSTYNPATNGQRPGFQCRNSDGSVVVLDESMFGFHLIAKGVTTVPQFSQAYGIDVPVPDGRAPVLAIWTEGDNYVQLTGGELINSTTYRFYFRVTTQMVIHWYAFGQALPQFSGIAGARWWDSTGTVLMGDTSIPMMKVVRPNLIFNVTTSNSVAFTEPTSNRIAIIVNHPGFYLYKSASTGSGSQIGGSATLVIHRAGVWTTGVNTWNAYSALWFGSGAGGTNEIRTAVPALFTTVDVSGL
jgi:hypothetical protein